MSFSNEVQYGSIVVELFVFRAYFGAIKCIYFILNKRHFGRLHYDIQINELTNSTDYTFEV